jgi:hypothetical protein
MMLATQERITREHMIIAIIITTEMTTKEEGAKIIYDDNMWLCGEKLLGRFFSDK